MIDNHARNVLAGCSSVLTFMAMLLLMGSYSYGSGQKRIWLALFQVRVAYIPLLFYILGLAMASGLFMFIAVSYFQRRISRPITEKVHSLAKGNFEDPIFNRVTPALHENKELYLLHQDLFQIKEKLLELSSELQVLNQQPQRFEGQTKEEILEVERHRLARELHDSVSQELFAAMMMLSALTEVAKSKEAPLAEQKQLETVAGIINTAQSEMRALLLHLRPVSLEDKSLKKGIEQLLAELQTKIEIAMTWEIADIALPKNI
ncbi:MAG TPA: histidine kinase, partial [Tetragenococcus sp.]|nr:histidine kinase [Tetragenococcus sp.]